MRICIRIRCISLRLPCATASAPAIAGLPCATAPLPPVVTIAMSEIPENASNDPIDINVVLLADESSKENVEMFLSDLSANCMGDIYVSENATFPVADSAPANCVRLHHAYTDALNEITTDNHTGLDPDISQLSTSSCISRAVESW